MLDTQSLSHHLLQTNSHFKHWVGASGEEREQTEGIRGLRRGYYCSGHGSLHIFHGSWGVLSQLLEDHIHFKHL